MAESLVVIRSSCKRATSRTICGDKPLDFTMSKSSLIVADEGSAEPGHEKLRKAMYREDDMGKMASCFRERLSCEPSPETWAGKI